jgi:hypothetical protein
LDFSRDRPRFAECIQQTLVLEKAAVAALKEPEKAASHFECDALGLREDGSVPRHAREEQWPLVVEARKAALMVEASRTSLMSDYVLNAQGLTADGESFFKFCTNYDIQRGVFSVARSPQSTPTLTMVQITCTLGIIQGRKSGS